MTMELFSQLSLDIFYSQLSLDSPGIFYYYFYSSYFPLQSRPHTNGTRRSLPRAIP